MIILKKKKKIDKQFDTDINMASNQNDRNTIQSDMLRATKYALEERNNIIAKGIAVNGIFTGMDIFYLNNHVKDYEIYKLVNKLYSIQGRIDFVKDKMKHIFNNFIETYKIKEKAVKLTLNNIVIVGKCFNFLTEWLNQKKISIYQFASDGTWPPKKEIKWDSRDYDTIVNNFSVKDLVEYYMDSSLYPERLVNFLVGKGDSNKGKRIIDNLIYSQMNDYLENLSVKNLFEGMVNNMTQVNIDGINKLILEGVNSTLDIVSVMDLDSYAQKISFDTSAVSYTHLTLPTTPYV